MKREMWLPMAVRDYPLYQPDSGWAEQAPEDWQQAALKPWKQVVVEQSGVNRGDIQESACPARCTAL
ncbi:MAG: hypothetical protein ACLR0U_19045 [Enterocloster clostridioformis]